MTVFCEFKKLFFLIIITKTKLSEDTSIDVIKDVCVLACYFVNERGKESEGQDLIGAASK